MGNVFFLSTVLITTVVVSAAVINFLLDNKEVQ